MAELPEPEIVDIAGVLQSYADGDIDLICVLGPTASGKTRYAVRLAKGDRQASLLRMSPA